MIVGKFITKNIDNHIKYKKTFSAFNQKDGKPCSCSVVCCSSQCSEHYYSIIDILSPARNYNETLTVCCWILWILWITPQCLLCSLVFLNFDTNIFGKSSLLR